jgi:hypothetical protein
MGGGNPQKAEIQVVPQTAEDAPVMQITRGEVDMQVSTAKQYPRSLKRFADEALSMATLTEDVAASCSYAFRKAGKLIEGPSIRFAEIAALCWGNLRAEAMVTGEDEKWVHSQSTTWDMERNVLIRMSGRRRIIDKNGRRYSDDLIATTAQAAKAIEYRNAVLKTIPKAYWGPIWDKAREVAKGDVSTLLERRTNAMTFFARYGVDQARVLEFLGKASLDDVDLNDVAQLVSVANGVKGGETNLDDIFPPTVDITKPGRVGFARSKPPERPAEGAPSTAEPEVKPASPPPQPGVDWLPE